MTDELRQFRDAVARTLEQLKAFFRDPASTKVTMVIRQAAIADGSADIIIGDDDFREAARVIERQAPARVGDPKPLGVAIAELVTAAQAEARAAALGLPTLLRSPEAADELLAAVRNHLLTALDQVLAGPDAHALSLESAADRARLRELVAAAVSLPITTARSA
jgi:hypothetical protein